MPSRGQRPGAMSVRGQMPSAPGLSMGTGRLAFVRAEPAGVVSVLVSPAAAVLEGPAARGAGARGAGARGAGAGGAGARGVLGGPAARGAGARGAGAGGALGGSGRESACEEEGGLRVCAL